jgi:hypothetical protein
MTIYADKPAVNVKERLGEVDKPSGVAGEALLRADTTRQQQELLGIGRRNIVMNGGFDVWQRGTSVTEASNSYNNFTADRWSAYFAGTYTKQQTTLPNGDYVNYFRGVLGTTSANRININHFIENGNSIMSGKYVTVSFWLACDRPGSEVNVKLQTTSGTSFTSYTQIANEYIKTEQDWKKYEITFHCFNDLGNNSARPHGLLEFDGSDAQWPNGSTFEIAQVQIEIGRVATPFEHRSYGEELALCERYYQQLDISGMQITKATTGTSYSNADLQTSLPFRTVMRDNPSFGNISGGITLTANAYTSTYASAGTYEISGFIKSPQLVGFGYQASLNGSVSLPANVTMLSLTDNGYLDSEL